jgi:hypothetical protein
MFKDLTYGRVCSGTPVLSDRRKSVSDYLLDIPFSPAGLHDENGCQGSVSIKSTAMM